MPDVIRQKINLAELLEIRDGVLAAPELLALLSISCERLTAIEDGADAGVKLFSPEQIFLTRDGNVEIQLIPNGTIQRTFVPPELQGLNGNAQQAPKSNSFSTSEARLVWCLGKSCLQAALSDPSDVALFSLLNLMTVAQPQSRPTLAKVRQMIRNRLDVVDLDRVPALISALHREVMGDLDELLADQFGDDIRFSSSRSSQLSIIPGPGAPERIIKNPTDYQDQLNFEMANRLRISQTDQNELIDTNHHDTNPFSVDIPDRLLHEREVPNRSTPAEVEEEDELTPIRGPTPDPKQYNERDGDQFEQIALAEMESGSLTEKEWKLKPTPIAFDKSTTEEEEKEEEAVESLKKRNIVESIEVEVHLPPHPASAHLNSSQQPTAVHQQKPATGRLFTKAAQAGKMPRAVTTRRESTEIEVLSDEKTNQKQQRLEMDGGDGDEADGTLPPLTGYSPGTRRKAQQMENKEIRENEEESPLAEVQFRRQNSLEPSKCSRRRSSGRSKGLPGSKSTSFLPTVPEFLTNGRQPLIRLRAQSMKKKKMVTLHRSDPAIVFVRLLNGYIVEVNCRTDALVGSIFHTVAEHLNITEHLFFGLSLHQQEENIFLEEGQRLEKWAPPGWKGPGLRRSFGAGGTLPGQKQSIVSSEQYTLHLRFRYYPKKREFVKTSTTAHQLYLQLRQDMLNGSLRFSPSERAFEAAALALCAESSTIGDGRDYFKLENYLPAKYYDVEPAECLKVQRRVAELHRRLAASFGHLEAEEQFIARCQMEPLYGAHFYRVHKMKPKRGPHSVQPRALFSDTRLVAVMPSGIGICREEKGGTQRFLNSVHEWHMIRTLQFDRKRFLLGTIEDNIAVDHVFYTDHHSKASYLVRFAASQHRFMLKMRQWQGTLNRMHVVQRQKDVGVEQRGQNTNGALASGIESAQPIVGTKSHSKQSSYPQMGIGQRYPESYPASTVEYDVGGSFESPNRLNFETENEYIQYCYGSEAQRIDVMLEKDPKHGLGLTLVDGAVNGVKGVYVKSVSAEGDGKRKGLLIGDCLLSVNGTSLFNKSRHDAVELVRDCGHEVRLEILRFPSISEVLSHQDSTLGNQSTVGKAIDHLDQETTKQLANNTKISKESAAKGQITEQESVKEEVRKESTATNESKASSHSSVSAQRRQRAQSDFGATFLPTLRTDDILSLNNQKRKGVTEEKPERYRRHKTSAGFVDSRSDDSDSGSEDGGGKRGTEKWRGEYKPQLPPVSAMYSSFLNDDEEEEDHSEKEEEGKRRNSPKLNSNNTKGLLTPNSSQLQFGSPYSDTYSLKSTPAKSPFASAVERFARINDSPAADSLSWHSAKRSAIKSYAGEYGQKGNNLDWATCLSDIDGDDSSGGSESPITKRHHHKFTVRIPPLASGAHKLPFELQFLPEKGVFIRAVDDERMPQSAKLCIGDRIISINGISVSGYSHEEIVKMIRESRGEVELVVERVTGRTDMDRMGNNDKEEENEREEILVVTLDKAQDGAIGLSLAKRMGFEGVFVRNIAPGSIAAREGTLRVGDRVWRVQGERIPSGESPAQVVQRLKDLSGEFSIEVRRRRHKPE